MAAEYDVVVVGAGIAGLYATYRLRCLGITKFRVIDAASGIGGTWFWNRYPGAKCDIESAFYSYSFSEELEQEWKWKSRYGTQPEILAYLNHVADKFDLRKDIQLNTRINQAIFDEDTKTWLLVTNQNSEIRARFVIFATGCLSAPKELDMKGLNTFKGDIYFTSRWPHEKVNFSGRTVAVIGTGSSGIQTIPVIAQEAEHVYVFQRTPNFSVPAADHPFTPEQEQQIKSIYPELRKQCRDSFFGLPASGVRPSALSVTPEERTIIFEEGWRKGGFHVLLSFGDIIINPESNDICAEFVRSKIRETVKDPVVAETLSPKDYPVATKRLCVDTNYYDTFNRSNVTLINLRSTPIEEFTPTGLRTTDREYKFDSVVFATGFDAMTGAMTNIDIQGRNGLKLKDKWASGAVSYLGLAVAGFPNIFIVTGAGSPSVLTNMIVSIEQHIDWMANLIKYVQDSNLKSFEPSEDAEKQWIEHNNQVANATLFPTCPHSWYVGANVPGKPRQFLPYIGGFNTYAAKCDEIARNSYEGFILS